MARGTHRKPKGISRIFSDGVFLFRTRSERRADRAPAAILAETRSEQSPDSAVAIDEVVKLALSDVTRPESPVGGNLPVEATLPQSPSRRQPAHARPAGNLALAPAVAGTMRVGETPAASTSTPLVPLHPAGFDSTLEQVFGRDLVGPSDLAKEGGMPLSADSGTVHGRVVPANDPAFSHLWRTEPGAVQQPIAYPVGAGDSWGAAAFHRYAAQISSQSGGSRL